MVKKNGEKMVKKIGVKKCKVLQQRKLCTKIMPKGEIFTIDYFLKINEIIL